MSEVFSFSLGEVFAKLIEIIEGRLKTKPKRELMRDAVILHGSLELCNRAYGRYLENPDDDISYRQWAAAIDGFVASLANLDGLLSIFEPALAENLRRYAISERRIAELHDPRTAVRNALNMLAYVAGETDSPYGISGGQYSENFALEEIEDPTDRLGEYIAKNFKQEDIHKELKRNRKSPKK